MGFSLFAAVGWIALAALLAAIALTLRRPSPATGLTVLARLPVEPRRALLVVEVAGRVLLLSSSEAGLSMLVELEPAAAAAFARTEPTPGLLSLFAAARRG